MDGDLFAFFTAILNFNPWIHWSFDNAKRSRAKVIVHFVQLDSTSPYDVIMGQLLLFDLKAIVSMYHYSIKFPMPYGVEGIKGNKEVATKSRVVHYPTR